MPQHRRDDGFRNLTVRIKSGSDETAWDELLERILPDLWRAAIQMLGDDEPPAVGCLVGGTLVAIAAHLEDFEPGEDDLATYAEFGAWWRSLMLAAAPGLQPAPNPPESKDRPLGSDRQAASPPRFDASLPPGKRLLTLVQGMASPPTDVERENLLHEMLPGLWRAAIHMLGDEQPRRVALLVDETVAAVLVHLGAMPSMEDDLAFDRWWHDLMIHMAGLLPG